jgi:hypothetical protein
MTIFIDLFSNRPLVASIGRTQLGDDRAGTRPHRVIAEGPSIKRRAKSGDRA